jgi:hypothetical protein
MNFEHALAHWIETETAYRSARRTFELAFASALLASQAPSAERRKAEAEVATADARAVFDLAEIEARAAEHLVMHLRRAGEAEAPP